MASLSSRKSQGQNQSIDSRMASCISVIYKEMLSSATPGRLSKQAPRMLITMIAALENLVSEVDTPPYLRVFAWWLLLQNWSTLRFSDHRGLLPSWVLLREGSFSASITQSKSRPVVVGAACFLLVPDWLTQGWSFLTSIADFQREYLMPAPSNNYQACIRRELRYDTAFLQSSENYWHRLKIGGEQPLQHIAKFWTPHSGRTFMPSATAALGVDKGERDYLGGAGRHKAATALPESQNDASQICKRWSSQLFNEIFTTHYPAFPRRHHSLPQSVRPGTISRPSHSPEL